MKVANAIPVGDRVQVRQVLNREACGYGKTGGEFDHEIRRRISISIGYLLQSPRRLPVYFIVMVPRPCMSIVMVPV